MEERDIFDFTPFAYNCWLGRNYMNALIAPHTNINDRFASAFGFHPLALACYRGHLELVKALWSVYSQPNSGYDVNSTDIHGMSIFTVLLNKIEVKRFARKDVTPYKKIRDFLLSERPELINETLRWSIARKILPISRTAIELAIWNKIDVDDTIFDANLTTEMNAMINYRSAHRGKTMRKALGSAQPCRVTCPDPTINQNGDCVIDHPCKSTPNHPTPPNP